MDLNTRKKLNNGVEMPIFGLGVYKSADGEETYNAVRWALDAGYRHIDTAAMYGNEASVGRAIRDSGIAREDIFVTTKLWNTEIREHNEENALNESLKKLGMDYVDLYLIHWPVREEQGYIRAWKKLEQFNRDGRCRAIGVSNYNIHHLEDVLKVADIIPALDQVECHPYLAQKDLQAFCEQHGIALGPWSPLGRGRLLDDEVLTALAAKYGKTTAQIVLRWDVQRGFINIPKSVHKERIIANAQVFDFSLTVQDMQKIFALDQDLHFGSNPETFTF